MSPLSLAEVSLVLSVFWHWTECTLLLLLLGLGKLSLEYINEPEKIQEQLVRMAVQQPIPEWFWINNFLVSEQ